MRGQLKGGSEGRRAVDREISRGATSSSPGHGGQRVFLGKALWRFLGGEHLAGGKMDAPGWKQKNWYYGRVAARWKAHRGI